MNSLMTRAKEIHNQKVLEFIINYKIPYSEKAKNKFIHPQKNLLRTEEEKFLDKFFSLGKDKRIFYKIKLDKQSDEGYKIYKSVLLNQLRISEYNNNNMNNIIHLSYPKAGSSIILQDLLKYENYKNNTIEVGKQTIKLFKLLLKNAIISKEYVDYINNYKISNAIYLCISRNPIDYLFCSTDQSFSSCIALGDYYPPEGLLNLYCDSNRALIFITDGKTKDYYLENGEQYISHFRYVSRSWLLVNKDDTIFIIRSYPSYSFNFKNYIEKIGYNIINCDDRDDIEYLFKESKFEFYIPEIECGLHSFIYLDNIGLQFNEITKKFYYSSQSGHTGDSLLTYKINRRFGILRKEDYNLQYLACNICGRSFEGSYLQELNVKFYMQNLSQYICSDCYNKITKCLLCNNKSITISKTNLINTYRNTLFDIFGYRKFIDNTKLNNHRTIPLNFEIFDPEIERIYNSSYIKSICESCVYTFINYLFYKTPIEYADKKMKIEIKNIWNQRKEFNHNELVNIRDEKQKFQNNLLETFHNNNFDEVSHNNNFSDFSDYVNTGTYSLS